MNGRDQFFTYHHRKEGEINSIFLKYTTYLQIQPHLKKINGATSVQCSIANLPTPFLLASLCGPSSSTSRLCHFFNLSGHHLCGRDFYLRECKGSSIVSSAWCDNLFTNYNCLRSSCQNVTLTGAHVLLKKKVNRFQHYFFLFFSNNPFMCLFTYYYFNLQIGTQAVLQ